MSLSIVSLKKVFHTASLYNVLPPSSSLSWEPQCKLFEGQLSLEELITCGNSTPSRSDDDMPHYQLNFQWNESEAKFCNTQVIKSLGQLNETIEKKDRWFRITMSCCGCKVPLELRIENAIEDQRFRDMLFRIREEYEMIDEMIGIDDDEANSDQETDFGEFVSS